MLPDMLRRDRERWGMSAGEAGWRLGIDGGGNLGQSKTVILGA